MISSPMHIAFCVNDHYAEYILVSIKGLLENNSDPLVIHILSDYISDKNTNRLKKLVGLYPNAILDIVIVDDLKLKDLKDTWTIYTWYRVLLPEILDASVHRVLYLDADTLVSENIEELFSLDMTGKAIAGTVDFQSKDKSTYQRCGYEAEKEYVCAGVMMMNLDYWREHDIANKIIDWGRDYNDRIQYPDQDAINYICRDMKLLLPLKYDIIDGFFQDDYYFQNYPQELRECIESPAIIHYAGQVPWVVEISNHLLQDEWERYNKLLSNPVKKVYQSTGFLKLKVIIYRLLHHNTRRKIKQQNIINRLNYDS